MINNGFIVFITETGGGQDADFNPISTTEIASTPFACNIEVMTRDYKLLVDGQYKDAKYSVYVDSFLIDSIDLNTINKVRLQDEAGNDYGESYQIQNKENLALTQKKKIIL